MGTPDHRDDPDELFARLSERNSGAFGAIVARVWDSLLRFAQGRLRKVPELQSSYDAEDALLSGLGELWRGIRNRRIRPPDGFDMFLRLARTIIGRRILARARKERAPGAAPLPAEREGWADGPLISLVPDHVNLSDIGVPPEEVKVIARDESEWLMSLLGPDLRAVIEARLAGLPVAEIAENLGISDRTVQRRLKDVIYIWHEAARPRDRWETP